MIDSRLIKGNREWTIMSTATGFIVRYGTIGGKFQTKPRVVAPKGGRTFEQQVTLEINSRINKQRDKGYHLPGEDPPLLTKPMLAHPYDPSRVTYPVALQEKLNGVRCVALCKDGAITLQTRTGKPITSMAHIVQALSLHMADGDVWDGEIYNPKFSLQEISGAVRRAESRGIAPELEYWIYDEINPAWPFSERDALLEKIIGNCSPPLHKVHTYVAYTESGIDVFYNSVTGRDGEGIMIRNPSALYQDKRTYDLMKRKAFRDSEFAIVGHKRDADGCLIWVCAHPSGTFDVVPTGTKESRKISGELARQFYGEELTVRYSDVSDYGVPQGNPVGVCIRNYE